MKKIPNKRLHLKENLEKHIVLNFLCNIKTSRTRNGYAAAGQLAFYVSELSKFIVEISN